MTKAIGVEVDLEAECGYIVYSSRKVAETRDIWEEGTVAANLDAEGGIIGIEVLGLDSETLSRAREYAEQNELVFPPMLDLAAS